MYIAAGVLWIINPSITYMYICKQREGVLCCLVCCVVLCCVLGVLCCLVKRVLCCLAYCVVLCCLVKRVLCCLAYCVVLCCVLGVLRCVLGVLWCLALFIVSQLFNHVGIMHRGSFSTALIGMKVVIPSSSLGGKGSSCHSLVVLVVLMLLECHQAHYYQLGLSLPWLHLTQILLGHLVHHGFLLDQVDPVSKEKGECVCVCVCV